MFGWRRKSDGFEWHEHVRTTIRIKREDRRRRIDEARHLAAEGLSHAGRAGVAAGSSGAHLIARWAKAVAEAVRAGCVRTLTAIPLALDRVRAISGRALMLLLEGAGRALKVGLEYAGHAARCTGHALNSVGRGLSNAAGAGARVSSAGLGTAGGVLTRLVIGGSRSLRNSAALPLLALVGAVATAAASIRLLSAGMSSDALFTLLFGCASLLAVTLALTLGGRPIPLSTHGYDLALLPEEPRDRRRLSLPFALPSGRLAGMAVVALVACSALAGGGWLVWQGASSLVSAASSTGLFAQAIEGRATAVTGDVLRIGKTEIRLDGIDAPEPAQRCAIPGNRRWRCGDAARQMLARMTRGETVACSVSGTDDTGRALGSCQVAGKDLAESLVAGGHVFAETGLFSKYGAQEEQAQVEKVGIWRGNPERPSEYRARLEEEMARAWEAAKRRAPRGCPIKGNIARGRKYYVLPGTAEYHRVRIQTRRGERWFCSEEEAVAAGWKRSPRS